MHADIIKTMAKKQLMPDYIFESSWEVCNKVGGIYTVLSTRAKTLQEVLQDKIIFIGPDFWKESESPYFKEDQSLFADWQGVAKEQGLKVRVGRWTVPGEPVAILVDFNPYFEKKDEIYGWLWEHYSVDSLHAYGDYDEASMSWWWRAITTTVSIVLRRSSIMPMSGCVVLVLFILTTNCLRLVPSSRRMPLVSAVLLPVI